MPVHYNRREENEVLTGFTRPGKNNMEKKCGRDKLESANKC